jgi:hypothetical protein
MTTSPVAGIGDALQRSRDVLQKRVAVAWGEGPGGSENGGELFVGQRDRPHRKPKRASVPLIELSHGRKLHAASGQLGATVPAEGLRSKSAAQKLQRGYDRPSTAHLSVGTRKEG